jgi:hypothetical protein
MKKPAPREVFQNSSQASADEPEVEPMDLMEDIEPAIEDPNQDPDRGIDVEAEQELANEAAEVDEEEPEELPEKVWPTLEQYQAKWEAGLAEHSRQNTGPFSRENLVPEPISQLWQDVPFVSFDKLTTDDGIARLSRCRPIAGFRESHCDTAGIHYAHCSGEVNFRRRAPLQLASTLGFILSKRSGKFMRLKPEDRKTKAVVFLYLVCVVSTHCLVYECMTFLLRSWTRCMSVSFGLDRKGTTR